MAGNIHHLNFPRVEHNIKEPTRKIRVIKGLMPLVDEDVHKELHKVCPPVPTLGYYAALAVERNLGKHDDTFRTLDNYFREIEKATSSPNARETEWELGQVIIHSLQLQMPFLRSGLIVPRRAR